MTRIMGTSVASAYQMATFLLSKNSKPSFSTNISAQEFCQLYLDVCVIEGVRGDIAFAQACKETGYFKFGGDVKYTQNNFAGIGATGGVPGDSFPSINIGILAHAQHLKSYATKDDLNYTNVDPRRTTWFMKAKGGTSPSVETLGGAWAVPGYDTKKYTSLEEANNAKDSYGYQIISILNDILMTKDKEAKGMVKVAVDAGHGSKTAGKRTPDGYLEHWINVKTAYYCEQTLIANGIQTIRVGWNDLNATDDEDISLAKRQKIIKDAKCDYSISCHANAYSTGWNSANGVETLIHNSSSKAGDSLNLAKKVQEQLIKGTPQTNRGVKKSALAMCNCTTMGTKASVLIEIGFMTNAKEAELMKTEEFCKEQGTEAAYGILAYLGISNVKAANVTTPTASTSFVVKCLTDLNIRKAPNSSADIVMKNGCKKGQSYTIVETNGTWGKLKSGLGWINISAKYVQKL